jgi:hypothetical protein
MTKRLIDVDNAKLDLVRSLLGTETLKATVNAALDEVIALDRRRRDLIQTHGVEMAEFADDSFRERVWG